MIQNPIMSVGIRTNPSLHLTGHNISVYQILVIFPLLVCLMLARTIPPLNFPPAITCHATLPNPTTFLIPQITESSYLPSYISQTDFLSYKI